MKLLFIHASEKIKKDTLGNQYTDGSYTNEVWKNYEILSEDITVIFRQETEIYNPIQANLKFNRIPNNIKLVKMHDLKKNVITFFNFRKRKQNRKLLESQIIKSDFIIFRGNNYTGVKIAKKYNKKYLIEVVGCAWDSLWHHSIQGKILAPISFAHFKKSISSAPYVLYVTESYLQAKYPTNGKSIGCSDVNISSLHEKTMQKRINKIQRLNIECNGLIIGTAGAIDVKYKGHKTVLEAMALLRRLKPDLNLEYRLAGSGNKQKLQSLASRLGLINNVVFLGSLTEYEIWDYYDNLDVYIQPSKTEGMPRALIEAMSRGCPALASSVGGIPELLCSENLFNPGSSEELLKLLLNIDNKWLRKNAVDSFEIAGKYDKKLLNKRRQQFYLEIKNSINMDRN